MKVRGSSCSKFLGMASWIEPCVNSTTYDRRARALNGEIPSEILNSPITVGIQKEYLNSERMLEFNEITRCSAGNWD